MARKKKQIAAYICVKDCTFEFVWHEWRSKRTATQTLFAGARLASKRAEGRTGVSPLYSGQRRCGR